MFKEAVGHVNQQGEKRERGHSQEGQKHRDPIGKQSRMGGEREDKRLAQLEDDISKAQRALITKKEILEKEKKELEKLKEVLAPKSDVSADAAEVDADLALDQQELEASRLYRQRVHLAGESEDAGAREQLEASLADILAKRNAARGEAAAKRQCRRDAESAAAVQAAVTAAFAAVPAPVQSSVRTP